ncbi:MAG: PASTA domain-containing protein [bacterium]
MLKKMMVKEAGRFAVYALVFGVIAAFGFDVAMRLITREKKVVLTPDVAGLTVAEAMDVLQGKGLYAEKSKENVSDETIPAGSVVRQSPVSGSVVKKGRAVYLTLSEGGNLVYVPDVTGRTLQEVEIILTRAALSVGSVTGMYSDEVKRDVIISQTPGAGEIAKPQTLVDIVKSNGPASLMGFLVMPYVVGKSSSEALNVLQEIGFDVSEQEIVINDTAAPGTVIKQEPAPGEMLSDEVYIKLFISHLSQKENIKRTGYVFFEVPQDIKARNVKIVIRDSVGRRTVYENVEQPGKKISFEVEIIGKAYAMFYLDDVPVGRKDL